MLALIALVAMWLLLILVCFSLTGAARMGDRTAERTRDPWDGWRN
jgi:hypothetical protein